MQTTFSAPEADSIERVAGYTTEHLYDWALRRLLIEEADGLGDCATAHVWRHWAGLLPPREAVAEA